MIAVTEDVMHEYLANAMAERSKWTRDPLIMRRAIIAEYRASFWSSWAAPAGTYMARSIHLRGDNRHDGVRPRVPGDVSRDARCDALLADWMKGHPAP